MKNHSTRVLLVMATVSIASLPLAGLSGAALPAPTNETQTIVVTAQKWTEPLQSVPGAVTVKSGDDLDAAGIHDLRDAAAGVPNLTLGDFSVRRLTFPYVRGIGSGRNNPAVTTVIDGVPQLSYATANQEWNDVERVEFLRGAQSSLYGRNALGGVINVVPRLPSRDTAGRVTVTGGSENYFDTRATLNGPAGADEAAGSVSAGYSRRDGYSRNTLTGNRLDDRESFFGGAQVLWPDQGPWGFRLSLNAESDRDGDYALSDLATLRSHPREVSHDFEGHSDRDLAQPVFTATRRGEWADFSSITAFQWWESHDVTDLDATPADLIRRDNKENQQAFIEELRLASPDRAPLRLGDEATLRWLVGSLAFHSSYSQRAFNEYRPLSVAMLGIPFPYQSHDDGDLEDTGLSLFGNTTVTCCERLDLGFGLRGDYEHRSADIRQYAAPAFMPGSGPEGDADFTQVTPRGSLGYHLTRHVMAYAEASKGYKAGGFNTLAIPGHATFDEETSWTYETGLKTDWLARRVTANVALFQTDWEDLQLDVPTGMPGVYYLDNTGKAKSQGGEAELTVTPVTGLTLFGGVGLLSSEFEAGSSSGGIDLEGKDLPFAPQATWNAGAMASHALNHACSGFVRLDATGASRYFYDAANGASQGTCTLVNARLGVSTGAWRVEGWVRNLFDKETIPLAFAYPLAPSGYVGESGAPRTLGISMTRTF